ncbi:MAG: sugar isomerase [Lachnospiraceae bacterium]|nr:sugar isomerase [Lachnospiraceae bacterium]
MRGKRLARNTISSLVFQVTTIICGFILPKLILNYFGSEVNGLVNSITQFLQIIAFLELGVGAVVQSSLYKPLAEKDNTSISEIIASADKFFNRLARILAVYIVVLVIVYPYLANQNFGWSYTAGLIAAMSISSFAQYYFGVVDRLLLTADQKGYIQYNAQTITLILNTITCAVLICLGASIHLVKLTTSVIYLARPAAIRIYVNKNYRIDRKIQYTGEPIKQKWNGVAQHVSAVVLDGTDSIILTVFSTLSDVSIYSVYHLVIYGIKQLFTSMTRGVQSLLGELWAKQELDELKKIFSLTEWAIHTGTVFVFGCTGILILPFVQVYTNGVADADYYQPLFAVLITMAQAAHSLRLPYNIMILAAGHYKQTQNNYIISAVLNIVISIIAVNIWGLTGVAIGTLAAMSYQTIWMAVYDFRCIMKSSMGTFFRQLSADAITVIAVVICTRWIHMNGISYAEWIVMAIKTTVVSGAVVIGINCLFYKEKIVYVLKKIKK